MRVRRHAKVQEAITFVCAYFEEFTDILMASNVGVLKGIPGGVAGAFVRKGSPHIAFNVDFVERATLKQVVMVMLHECCHLVLDHVTSRAKANPKIYNCACDLLINDWVERIIKSRFHASWREFYMWEEDGEREGLFFGENGMPNFYNVSSDYIYTELLADNDLRDRLEGSEEVEAISNGHKVWEEMSDGTSARRLLSESSKELADADPDFTPPEIEKNLREIVATPFRVDYRQALQQFTGRYRGFKPKSDWAEYNEFMPGKMPGRRPRATGLPRILAAVDCSPSVDSETLERFKEEMNSIAKMRLDLDVIKFTNRIFGFLPDYKPGTFGGRESGGTSFEPVIEFFNKGKYNGLIIVTDGEVSSPCTIVPRVDDRHVLWVLTPDHDHIQTFGHTVVMEY